MKKIIFLGYCVNPENAGAFSGISIAGNNMQYGIIKNLARFSDLKITCVTVSPVAPFPREKRIIIKREEEWLCPNVRSIRIGFINLPVVKQIVQISRVFREVVKLLKNEPDSIIFCFNLFPQISLPIKKLNKKNKSLKKIALLADLPIDDKTERSWLSGVLYGRFDKITKDNLTICDKYIVLNEYVAKQFLPDKEYIVIDGGIDLPESERLEFNDKLPAEKNIVFSGKLNDYNGIINLLSAFSELDRQDVFLDIYGSGYPEEEEKVKALAEKDERIRYHGYRDNRYVKEKQKEAWLLINPRPVNDPISKVTFPSKTFEYLLSGVPVLTTRLNGYSQEYDDLMVFVDDNDKESLLNGIKKCLDMPYNDLKQMAKRGFDFVVKERNWTVLADKIKVLFE